MKFATPKAGVDSLSVVRIGVEGLHDKMDMVYFGAILRNIDGICGFDAQYDCPVAVTLYVDPSAAIPEKMLRDSIEVKEAHMLAHGGKVRVIPVHICPVCNLYDRAYLISGDDVVQTLPIAGRGKLQ